MRKTQSYIWIDLNLLNNCFRVQTYAFKIPRGLEVKTPSSQGGKKYMSKLCHLTREHIILSLLNYLEHHVTFPPYLKSIN